MKERRINLKPFSIIGLRFLDKNGVPSRKTYKYYLDEFLSNWLFTFPSYSIESSAFKIINERGYDYRGSEAVVEYARQLREDELYNDKTYFITEMTLSSENIPSHSRCFKGFSPSTEETMEEYYVKPLGKVEVAKISSDFSDLSATISNIGKNISSLNAALNEKYSDTIDSINQTDYDSYTTTTAPLIRFDSNGITVGGNIDLDYEKFNEKLEEAKLEKNRKEVKKMFENVMKNFEFGKCGENVKMSVYGPAFKDGEGNYSAFNGEEAMDVTGMTFDFECFYRMPVAHDDVQIGDYIYHRSVPVRVVDATERGSFVCVSLFTHEEVTVVPIKNMFGFNFFTKLVNFGEGLFGANTIDKSNPFGSMLPLFLMSKGGKNDNLMMAMMMSQGNLDFKSNPFMMMALMGDSKNRNDAILPLMMSQMLMPKHECKCGGKCSTSNPTE